MWTNQPPDRDDEKHARGAHSEAYRHGNVPRTLLSVSHRATSAAHPGENVRGRMSGGHAMPNPRPWMATVYLLFNLLRGGGAAWMGDDAVVL